MELATDVEEALLESRIAFELESSEGTDVPFIREMHIRFAHRALEELRALRMERRKAAVD